MRITAVVGYEWRLLISFVFNNILPFNVINICLKLFIL